MKDEGRQKSEVRSQKSEGPRMNFYVNDRFSFWILDSDFCLPSSFITHPSPC